MESSESLLLPRASTTLDQLPRELAHRISTHLTIQSLIAFGRVSRAFTHLLDERRLWSSLSLRLPLHYGESPSVLPLGLSEDEEDVWHAQQQEAVDEARRVRLKLKLSTLMCRADEGRWARVQSIDLDPVPGTLLAMTQILDFSAPSLMALRIYGSGVASSMYEKLDAKILDARIAFPLLTSIHLGICTQFCGSSLALLCNSSPNLTSLNVTFNRRMALLFDDESLYPFPPFDRPTSIQTARFAMTACQSRSEDDEVVHALVGMLESSPQLSQLSLPHDGVESTSVSRIMWRLAAHPKLQDLHWPIDLPMYREGSLGVSGFPELRRLVLACDDDLSWPELFKGLFSYPNPNLEHLYIDASKIEPLAELGNVKPVRVGNMPPDFAENLRDQPHLCVIHTMTKDIDGDDLDVFKRIDKLNAPTHMQSRVSSVVHQGEELLHSRFRMHLVEASDKSCSEGASSEFPHLQYSDRDVKPRLRIFRPSSHPVWQDYTSYDDLPVPLKIIERMRKVAGISKKEWRRRGVVVNDAAWAVLTEWHKEEEDRLIWKEDTLSEGTDSDDEHGHSGSR